MHRAEARSAFPAGRAFSIAPLERDLVVELLVEGASATAAERLGASELAAAPAGCPLASLALPAVEHGERGIEALEHDLGGVALLLSLIHISEPTRRTPISYA